MLQQNNDVSSDEEDLDKDIYQTDADKVVAELPISNFFYSLPIQFTKLTKAFPLFKLTNFLSDEQSEWITNYGISCLHKSNNAVALTKNGMYTFLPHLKNIQSKVSFYSGFPIENISSIQFIRVESKDEKIKEESEYLLTFSIYLRQDKESSTIFPNIDLTLRPEKGTCLFWPNTNWNGEQRFKEAICQENKTKFMLRVHTFQRFSTITK